MATNATFQEAALAATGESPAVAKHLTAPPLGGSASASQPKEDLERILPEIKDLALKVGGMDRLADLVNTLCEMKT
jgi:hypothetical protein